MPLKIKGKCLETVEQFDLAQWHRLTVVARTFVKLKAERLTEGRFTDASHQVLVRRKVTQKGVGVVIIFSWSLNRPLFERGRASQLGEGAPSECKVSLIEWKSLRLVSLFPSVNSRDRNPHSYPVPSIT